MLQAYSKGNITSLKDMWFKIATDLVASGGMTVETTYYDTGGGVPNYSSPSTTPSLESLVYVFAPTADMDPNTDQDWRLVVSLTESYYDIWAVTPTQIIQDGTSFVIAKTNSDPLQESGRFSKDNLADASALEANIHFFSRVEDSSSWSCHQGNEDANLLPLSYNLTVGTHGLVLTTWAEGRSKDGDCFNWFVIQRSVDSNGLTIESTKDPLFCAFSPSGGGDNDVNVIDPDGILKFVVREGDINAPTKPRSAVVPSADSAAWFNPIQQVSTSENGKFIVSFPRGLNTQRYRYDTELDMVAFASADVVAQGTEVPLTLYGNLRKYKAINANHINNKGMRLLIQIPL